MKNNTKPEYKPSLIEIYDTCLSFRHDYGLLSRDEQLKIHDEALWWYEAWQKTLSHSERYQMTILDRNLTNKLLTFLIVLMVFGILLGIYVIYEALTKGY